MVMVEVDSTILEEDSVVALELVKKENTIVVAVILQSATSPTRQV
jgi:hypothetical protein